MLPPRGLPRGVVHFLGGAFVGSAPELTVGHSMENRSIPRDGRSPTSRWPEH